MQGPDRGIAARQPEETLGYPLFLQEGRRLKPTPAGERLCPAVANGFEDITETLEYLSTVPQTDRLVLSTSNVLSSELIFPHFVSLRASIPGLVLDIRQLQREPPPDVTGIDIHLHLGETGWANRDCVPPWEERILPVCSPEYLARRGPILSVEALLAHDLIHCMDSFRRRMGRKEWFAARDVTPPSQLPGTLPANEPTIAMRAGELGEGITLGWRPIVDCALAQGRLVAARPETVRTGRRQLQGRLQQHALDLAEGDRDARLRLHPQCLRAASACEAVRQGGRCRAEEAGGR